jgi:hypothetical protein
MYPPLLLPLFVRLSKWRNEAAAESNRTSEAGWHDVRSLFSRKQKKVKNVIILFPR